MTVFVNYVCITNCCYETNEISIALIKVFIRDFLYKSVCKLTTAFDYGPETTAALKKADLKLICDKQQADIERYI